ncbi:hypothetical protein [Aeromicrobium sp. 179-A 4D2 NHS]|uniref:hypothetical protein n=1 Tax=Aeromicrobium sp. 179-A 4D2 NHS TaxID=3142375 RepID=UPI0039A15711
MFASGTFTPTDPGISFFDVWYAHLGIALVAFAIALIASGIVAPSQSEYAKFANRYIGWYVVTALASTVIGAGTAAFAQDAQSDAQTEHYTSEFEKHLAETANVNGLEGKVKRIDANSLPGTNQIFITYEDGSEGLVLYKFDGKKVTYRFLPVTAAEGL